MAAARAVATVMRLPPGEPYLQPALTVREMDQVGGAGLLSVAGAERDVDVAMALMVEVQGSATDNQWENSSINDLMHELYEIKNKIRL